MSLRINLAFCIILVLWTSVSGVIYTVSGQWEAEIKKCGSGGDDNRISNYNISGHAINRSPYFIYDSDTTVKVGGVIELTSGFTDPIIYREWPLDEFEEKDNLKTYKGELRIDAFDSVVSHVAYIGLTLTISRTGEVELQNYVYAGSWGSINCCSAKSFIHAVTIAF